MKRFISTSLFFASLLSLSGCAWFSDERSETFSDKDAATLTIEKGWIPDNIPQDAKEIGLRYNLDTNARAIKWVGSRLDTTMCRSATLNEAKKDVASIPVAKTLLEGLQLENAVNCGDYFYAEAGANRVLWTG